ncbi:MAG: hypothetical protein V7637_5429 [Mycobacteriales bacterium]
MEARSTARPVRVFISYAHGSAEHTRQVRELWLLLRDCGIDARLDLPAAEVPQDWALWMLEQVREADFVLVVASAAYRRRAEGLTLPAESRGVVFESGLVREALYADPVAARRKFLPVLFADGRLEDIPAFLGPTSTTHYRLPAVTPEYAEPLLRVLTGAPLVGEPSLGAPSGALSTIPGGSVAIRSANPPDVGARAGPAGRRLTVRDLGGLVDLLLAVTEITAPTRWQQVLDLLPSHVAHSVPRQSAGRPEAVALLWTCENYPGAWVALVDALHLIGPRSAAMERFTAEVRRLRLDHE